MQYTFTLILKYGNENMKICRSRALWAALLHYNKLRYDRIYPILILLCWSKITLKTFSCSLHQLLQSYLKWTTQKSSPWFWACLGYFGHRMGSAAPQAPKGFVLLWVRSTSKNFGHGSCFLIDCWLRAENQFYKKSYTHRHVGMCYTLTLIPWWLSAYVSLMTLCSRSIKI